jgi:propionyl-CoA carboxylase alpha chain
VYQLPEGKGIRVDNGFEQMDIPIYYDPMLVITYGETREEAIEIMINATSIITLLKVCKQPCLFGKYVMEHDALDQEIFDTCQKYYNAVHCKRRWNKRAESAFSYVQRYFEDQNGALT